MITTYNIKDVFLLLDKTKVKKELNKKHDFLKIELLIFNVGSIVTIKSYDYKKKHQKYCNNTGNLFLDKDNFLQLCKELNLLNHFKIN
jgi:hypothetical protein